ncbi:autotransporter [Bordetella pertussis]|nr:autotransporter [Bordetella pertussis]
MRSAGSLTVGNQTSIGNDRGSSAISTLTIDGGT